MQQQQQQQQHILSERGFELLYYAPAYAPAYPPLSEKWNVSLSGARYKTVFLAALLVTATAAAAAASLRGSSSKQTEQTDSNSTAQYRATAADGNRQGSQLCANCVR
jgi:hypothetical protein